MKYNFYLFEKSRLYDSQSIYYVYISLYMLNNMTEKLFNLM